MELLFEAFCAEAPRLVLGACEGDDVWVEAIVLATCVAVFVIAGSSGCNNGTPFNADVLVVLVVAIGLGEYSNWELDRFDLGCPCATGFLS